MKCLSLVVVALYIASAACGRIASQESRMGQEKHFQGGRHNTEYDHEAFLGKELKKTFDQLTEKEAKHFLGKIVDKIDKDTNGNITFAELKNWIGLRGRKWLEDDAARLWKFIKEIGLEAPNLTKTERLVAEKTVDMDEPIKWEEYKWSKFRDADINDPEGAKIIRNEKRRWQAADTNNDNRLSFEEYKSAIHPEQFDHTKIVHVQESLEQMDKDKDGYISKNEYIDTYYSREEKRTKRDEMERELKDFTDKRDKNKDGKLDLNELWEYLLGPVGFDHDANEAEHLFYHADDNKDGVLSKKEIIAHHDIFVGSSATDYGNDLPIHDEI